MSNENETPTAGLTAVTNAEALRDAVYSQKIAAPNKTTLPVLTHLHLHGAEDGTLRVGASDLDVWSEVNVEGAEVDVPGKIAVPAQTLYKVLNAIPKRERPDVPVLLSTEGEATVLLTVGGVEYRLLGLSGDEIPQYPDDGEPVGTVPMETVLTWTRRVAPFASSEVSRPILQGVHLDTEGSDPRVEATNGHYAMTYRGAALNGLDKIDAILPVAVLEHARRVFDKDESITLSVERDDEGDAVRLSLRGEHAWIGSRLVIGPYLNMVRIHPQPGTHALAATFDRKDAETVLKRLDPVASSQTHRIKIEPDPVDGSLVFSTSTPDMGSAEGSVRADVDVLDAETAPFPFGLNLKYLQQVLKGLNCDRVRLEAWHPERALMLHQEDSDELTALLMPLRLLD